MPPFAEALRGDATAGAARPAVFLCADDAGARDAVAALVADIGAEPVDAGPLAAARAAEPVGLLLVRLAYGQGQGPRIGIGLLRGDGR